MVDYQETSFCILNNQPVQLNIQDIFDFRKFNTFYGATYSASRSFILKYLFYYQQINLIVGAPLDRIQKEIQTTFEDLNNYYQVNNRKLSDINLDHDFLGAEMYIPPRGIIHSKIYLLSNKKLNNYRVITGSANLSLAAFSNTKDQYEEINISDNKKDYDLYFKRYQELIKHTTGYMDPETKKYLRKLGYFKS